MIKIENKKYLVTGGSGFLGIPLCKAILEKGGQVRVIARDEGKLISLKEVLSAVEIYTGDIADEFEVAQAMEGVSGVFHLAASKHVGLAETFVRENIKSNVIGSLNILEQSRIKPIDFVIGISTDKAAQVAGVYGATKLLMERAFQQYEKLNEKCQYRIVRYGNVLYSTGSVLCKWKEKIQKGEEIIITDPDATRFFWTVDEAISLIFRNLEEAVDSKPFCPGMKGIRLWDLVNAMFNKYGQGQKKFDVKKIGLQPGENKHEKILEDGPYSNEVEMMTHKEILEII